MMRPRWAPLTIVVALATCTYAGPPELQAANQQAVFRATANLVAVDATVMRGRNPVVGLTAADFVLTDNGIVQQIDSVSQGTMPLDLTIVLDFSVSARNDFGEFLRSAANMQRLLRPEDRWRWLGIFMEAREVMSMRPAHDPLPALSRPDVVNITALHDTVFLALVRPGEPERRHLVVVFTDGDDTWSMLDGWQLPSIAGKADAVLHAVISGSPAGPQTDGNRMREREDRRWRESQDALFDAVRVSGGSIHHLSNRAEAFAKIIEDFRSAYVLRYVPKGVDTPGWHEVKVSVNRPGSYAIRARKGYEKHQ